MNAHERLAYWITERHAIYERRRKGLPKPWTTDPILQQYRFCNVYRELDTVTQWVAANYRTSQDPDMWFAICVARLVNWPPTLATLGMPLPWDPMRFRYVMHSIAYLSSGSSKAFGGAYIVSTNGHAQDKADYLAQHVLTPMWKDRVFLRPQATDSLASFYDRLRNYNGMGSFMSAQVVADMKYAAPLCNASDWHSFAASGPGSRRGLNRLLRRELNAPWREDQWKQDLIYAYADTMPLIDAPMPGLHLQDFQNCLCEFDKYERVRLGEGRPRSTYPGT